ncbi:hypothetical protein [Congregibacter sp.]
MTADRALIWLTPVGIVNFRPVAWMTAPSRIFSAGLLGGCPE